MGKTHRTFIHIMLPLLLLLVACENSHHNEVIYRFSANEKAIPVDSLKTEILTKAGTEMLIMYPDSDVVIIQYDRYKTHQDIIETHFTASGYTIRLVSKTRINKKNQPWGKK